LIAFSQNNGAHGKSGQIFVPTNFNPPAFVPIEFSHSNFWDEKSKFYHRIWIISKSHHGGVCHFDGCYFAVSHDGAFHSAFSYNQQDEKPPW
jgi:hypothetical protein